MKGEKEEGGEALEKEEMREDASTHLKKKKICISPTAEKRRRERERARREWSGV